MTTAICEKSTRNTCPITLDEIEPENEIQHGGVSFDIFALYTYLTKTLYFLNPVTRVPFLLSELEDLEKRVRELCGEDSIIPVLTQDDATSCVSLPSDDDSVEDVDLHLEVLESDEECIRLQVNLSPSSHSLLSEVDSESDTFDPQDLLDIDGDDLPPRRCYPSVVELYKDKSRAARGKVELDLLQYLSYDALDLINQMVSLLTDSDFHQVVWEQTSSTILETVNRLLSERSDESRVLDIEVTYSDCWETYRTRTLNVLSRRYAEVIRDIKRVDSADAELYLRSHAALVESSDKIPREKKTLLLQTLRALVQG